MSGNKKLIISTGFAFLISISAGCMKQDTTSLREASEYSLKNPEEIVYNSIEVYQSEGDVLENIEPDLSLEQKEAISEALVTAELAEAVERPESSLLHSAFSFTDNEGWMRQLSIFQQSDTYYVNFLEDSSSYYELVDQELIELLEESGS